MEGLACRFLKILLNGSILSARNRKAKRQFSFEAFLLTFSWYISRRNQPLMTNMRVIVDIVPSWFIPCFNFVPLVFLSFGWISITFYPAFIFAIFESMLSPALLTALKHAMQLPSKNAFSYFDVGDTTTLKILLSLLLLLKIISSFNAGRDTHNIYLFCLQ